jgi:pantetheine-phosphate adenylyltransferase
MSPRVALFPGTFDPITYGHTEIIERALALFDRVVIGVGINSQKQTMFTVEQRVRWIGLHFKDEPRVSVETFTGLTVNYARQIGARYLLRGLRSAPDFEYEKNIDLLNQHLSPEVDTVYLIATPATHHISSTLVREVIRFKGNLEGLVPDAIVAEIYADRLGATS